METKDYAYVVFWSFALAFALYFTGFGNESALLFAMALIGVAFAAAGVGLPLALGACVLSLAFAFYFSSSAAFLDRMLLVPLAFLVLPSILMEVRAAFRK